MVRFSLVFLNLCYAPNCDVACDNHGPCHACDDFMPCHVWFGSRLCLVSGLCLDVGALQDQLPQWRCLVLPLGHVSYPPDVPVNQYVGNSLLLSRFLSSQTRATRTVYAIPKGGGPVINRMIILLPEGINHLTLI